MDLGLKGKVALVTGAGRGVGREIALSLAAEGAAVAVNYRSSAKDAEALVAEITGKGGKAKAYAADVADFAAVKAMVEAVAKDFGGLDILVNNAGLALRKRFVETTPEDWKKQIDACLYGAIHCCYAAAPHFEKAGNGRIVSVIGDSSRVGESGLANRRRRARRRGGADEIAGARARPQRHDRQYRFAGAGRDRS